MKRILQFKNTDKGYACIEGSERYLKYQNQIFNLMSRPFIKPFMPKEKTTKILR